jgi:carbonyl reductase 1
MGAVKTALVTGGNRGLGLGICRALARRGMRVLLTSREETSGQAAMEALRQEGLDVAYRQLDVASPLSISTLAEECQSAGEVLDLLVNNAGIALKGFDGTVARRTVEANFFGALWVTEALLALLRDRASILMVSSGMGALSHLGEEQRRNLLDPSLPRDELVRLMMRFVKDVEQGQHNKLGWPSSAYTVSKAGMNALTRVFARDLAPRGIAVNAVCPGWVRTDMGGPGADRSLEQGVGSILATLDRMPAESGKFWRDGAVIAW